MCILRDEDIKNIAADIDFNIKKLHISFNIHNIY